MKTTPGALPHDIEEAMHRLHLPHQMESFVIHTGVGASHAALEKTLVGLQREHLSPELVEEELRKSGIHMSYQEYEQRQLATDRVTRDNVNRLIEVRNYIRTQKVKRMQRQTA